MTEKHCCNCQRIMIENYCSNCGQRYIANHRLQPIEVISDFFDNTFNLHKGFFYTLWKLIINPGQVAHSYINGKRKSFTNPTRYLVIALAYQTFIDYWFKTPNIVKNEKYFNLSFLSEHINQSIAQWNILLTVEYILLANLFLIIIFPATLYILFRKLNFNYTELLTVSFYFISTFLMIGMTFVWTSNFFFGYFSTKETMITLFFTYIIWSCASFFKSVILWKRIAKIIVCVFIVISFRIFILPLILSILFPI